MLASELKAAAALGDGTGPAHPPHLEGVPACLHKYEPLLRRAWDERRATSAA